MITAQYRLITEELGISHLVAVTGISSGADHSVQFAVSYPDFMDGIFPIVGGTPFTTQGRLIGSWMISIIESCRGWDRGEYDANPKDCAANALTVLMPYLYTRDWWEYNVDTAEAYTKWRDTWGAYYLDVQDARDLYYRAMASGSGWLGDTPGFNNDLNAILRSIKAKSLFVLSAQDQFYPPQYVDPFVKNIARARVVWIDSTAGHLICCNADPNATRRMGDAIRQFLRELSAPDQSGDRRN
jgi:homoserine O-acetyltransferase